MAKRSKKSKRRGSRRRIGAALNPASPLVKLGAVAIGYFVAGKPINDMIDKVVPTTKIDGKIVGGATTGLGALLLMSKGRSSFIKTVAGGVIAGAGLKRALVAFGVVKAPIATAPVQTVTGYGKVPTIGGYNVPVIGSYQTPGTLGRVGATQGSDLIGNN
jgi:hypothetical protein